MDMRFCSTTAFGLLRTPSVAFSCLAARLDVVSRSGLRRFLKDEQPLGILDKPLCVLAESIAKHYHTANVRGYVLGAELLPGDVIETDTDMLITSPAMTLFTMARDVAPLHLAMAMSEFCGSFSVCPLTPEVRTQLDELAKAHQLPEVGGWKPVLNRQGGTTDLWKRPPLLQKSDLERFAVRMRGVRGIKGFVQALDMMVEGAASPFEVQTAMRFGLSRRYGGEGIREVRLNEKISLTRSARLIADKSVCYADLVLCNDDGSQSVIVECQSKLIHDNEESLLSDSTRLAALQSMGYTVIPVTYDQVSDRLVFDKISEYVGRELGMCRRPKSERLREKEADLCRMLFIDWATLAKSPHKHRVPKGSA